VALWWVLASTAGAKARADVVIDAPDARARRDYLFKLYDSEGLVRAREKAFKEDPAAVERSQRYREALVPWRYSDLIRNIERRNVVGIRMSRDGSKLIALDADGKPHFFRTLPEDPDLLRLCEQKKVEVTILADEKPVDEGAQRLGYSLLLTTLLLIALTLVLRRTLGGMGGIGGIFDIQKSGARVTMVPSTNISFNDVAGATGAKLELQEVVQFLKESERYTELGAQIPKGVILEGPPGSGKTLLARAVAGEAGVPFFSIAGSEFVELFVGVGASRVRELFGQAKRHAPCIVFIDEIDAVGRKRGEGYAGGSDEREQTLNQLLTEMDGFQGNSGIIVLAATNRPDVLDKALVRPGRFDRRIVVDLPDFDGRLAILEVHARNKPLAPDVTLSVYARRTPGFSGASLKNFLNEAAIRAARRGKSQIGPEEMEDALDRIVVGLEKKNAVMSQRKRELIAYHEAGHALLGALMPNYDQVSRISIVPRGSAGGLTFFAPDESRVDSGLYSRSYLEDQLSVALGGRVAEEIVFGDEEVTTGAANDFEQVTRIARQMVTKFGFSKARGLMVLEDSVGNPWMVGSKASRVSAQTQALVDKEVSRLVSEALSRARKLLTMNRRLLDSLARLLIDRESISGSELQELILSHPVRLLRSNFWTSKF